MENILEKIRVSGIVKESIVDGDGIRYVVFTQGCPHNCLGCHNPHTHDFFKGYHTSIKKMVDEIASNPMLKGITLSGGEPFMQSKALAELCRQVKKLGKDIWAYSGYTYEMLSNEVTEHSSELLGLVDVLVDGKFDIDKRDLTLKFKGSTNQRTIDCNNTRKLDKIVLWHDIYEF